MEKTEKKVKTVKRKKKAIKLKSGDFWLMLFTLMLVIFGVIMVFSASSAPPSTPMATSKPPA